MSDDAKREEIIRRRIRYVLPASGDGLAIGDFQAAVEQAYDDRERRGLSNEYHDALRVIAEDRDSGEVVLFFDVEEPAERLTPEPGWIQPCPHTDDQRGWLRWPSSLGWLAGPGAKYPVRVTIDVCDGEKCRTRLTRAILDAVGHEPVFEEYPTP